MGRDFYNVVGGVGVRLGEVGDDNFVDAARRALRGWIAGGGCPHVFIGGFNQFSEYGVSGFEIVFQAQQGQGDFLCVRPGQTDYADASSTGRRSDGDDCVVEVHRKIVAVLFWRAATGTAHGFRDAGLLAGL